MASHSKYAIKDIDELLIGGRGSRPQMTAQPSPSSGSENCGFCGEEMLPGCKRWKNCKQHFECGAIVSKGAKLVAKDMEAYVHDSDMCGVNRKFNF